MHFVSELIKLLEGHATWSTLEGHQIIDGVHLIQQGSTVGNQEGRTIEDY